MRQEGTPRTEVKEERGGASPPNKKAMCGDPRIADSPYSLDIFSRLVFSILFFFGDCDDGGGGRFGCVGGTVLAY